MSLAIWSVFCLAIGLFVGSGPKTTDTGPPLVFGLAVGALLWCMGTGAWEVVRWLVER